MTRKKDQVLIMVFYTDLKKNYTYRLPNGVGNKLNSKIRYLPNFRSSQIPITPHKNNIDHFMFVLLALGRSDFPDFCAGSTYEGPILDDHSAYADKRCIIFYDVENITNVTISTLTQLEWINLPDTIYIAESAFSEVKTLKTAILPNATEIYDNAFLNCESLTDVEIPNVVKVGDFAFKNTNLSELNAPTVKTLGVEAFSNNCNLKNVHIPDMTFLGSFSFCNCSSLSDINLSNILSLELSCFIGCHSIKSLFLAKAFSITTEAINMTSLEEIYAPIAAALTIRFENVNNFKRLIVPSVQNPIIFNLPDSIEMVDISSSSRMPSVFANKTKLRYLKADKVSEVSPLTGCVSLTIFSASNALTVPESAFEGCTQLTNVHIPMVVEVPKNCFKGCTKLKIVSGEFHKISESAFEGCESIVQLNLLILQLTGNNVFRGMKKLRKIRLTSLISANDHTGIFEGCESLEEVVLGCTPPTGLEENAFNVSTHVVNITLDVDTCYKNYKPFCKTMNGNLYFKGAYLMPVDHTIRNVLIGVGVAVVVIIIGVVVYLIIAKRKKIDKQMEANLLL